MRKISILCVTIGLLLVSALPVSGSAQSATEQELTDIKQTLKELQQRLDRIEQAQGTNNDTTGTVPRFTRDLARGDRGPAVRSVQRFLNGRDGIQVAAHGPGSPGQESPYFGPATRQAVKAFQRRHRREVLIPAGIRTPTGYWGQYTRAKANEILARSQSDTNAEDVNGGEPAPWEDSDGGQDFGGTQEATIEDFNARSGSHSIGHSRTEEHLTSFDFRVEDGTARVERIDITIEPQREDRQDEPERFFERISLWSEGTRLVTERIDEADAWSDGDDDGDGRDDYTIRLSGFTVHIRSGESQSFNATIDTKELERDEREQRFNVWIPDDGIRAVDDAGVMHELGDEEQVEQVGFHE